MHAAVNDKESKLGWKRVASCFSFGISSAPVKNSGAVHVAQLYGTDYN